MDEEAIGAIRQLTLPGSDGESGEMTVGEALDTIEVRSGAPTRYRADSDVGNSSTHH